MNEQPQRNGGDLVIETLTALGAKTVFGIPGQHALGLFDALSRSSLEFISSRVENNSAFAADGYSRATGEVGVLFLSTGALMSQTTFLQGESIPGVAHLFELRRAKEEA